MKKRIISIALIGLLVYLLFATCGCGEQRKKTNDTITIYKLTREDYISFLQNPTLHYFDVEKCDRYIYSIDSPIFTTSSNRRFTLEPSLIEFIGNNAKVEQYLQKNKVTEKIESVMMFDSPISPITIWVKTATVDNFITINENIEDEHYTYRYYDYNDYYDKFHVKSANLYINGIQVCDTENIKLYYNNADIPLVKTLEVFGANFEWDNETKATINHNKQIYYLDINEPSVYKSDNLDNNLLYRTFGGRIFICSGYKELIVDSATANTTLSAMGEAVVIRYDKQKLNIYIDSK